MKLKRFNKNIIDLLIIILFLLNATPSFNLPFYDSLERIIGDIRLRATMPNTIDDRIVIADIDEESIVSIGHWPWKRDKFAELLDTLFDYYEIKVVGFDMVFAEDDDISGLNVLKELELSSLAKHSDFWKITNQIKTKLAFDDQFANSLKDRHVVLGMVFNQSRQSEINSLPKPLAPITSEISNQLKLLKPAGFTANINRLQQQAFTSGFFDNPYVDDDGQFRRVPLLQIYNNALYPSLALAVTRLAIGQPEILIEPQVYDHNQLAFDEIQVGSLIIPVDEKATVYVPFRGVQGSFPYLSIKNILDKTINKAQLNDRIVLVGTTAPGLLDLRATPVAKALPGVEVHANIISGLLDHRIPHSPNWVLAFNLFSLLVIGLLMATVPNRLSPLQGIVFVLGLISLVIFFNSWAWESGWMIPLASPLLLIVNLFIIHMSWGYLVENKNKRSITKLFGQYVPDELVNEMIESPEHITLEGQSRDMTVLFADIRGFTGISEKLSPKELSQLLNDLLTPMTKVIHTHRGTIDKYMGDAIMAFWGAPLPDENHPSSAIKAALNMLQKLQELQPEFKRKGWPEIKMGVGLNSGIMSVGNMGSEYRMAYTVLGDAVNLGSRLEGLTKQYGVELIVSENTKNKAPHFFYRELDQVRVKGKNEPIKIFEPIALIKNVSDEIKGTVKYFEQALNFYLNQQWSEAEDILKLLQKNANGLTIQILYDEYLFRIESYKITPPPRDWDGVFTHTNK